MSIQVKDLDTKISNVKVFQNTREISRTKFLEQTLELETNTRVYEKPTKEDILDMADSLRGRGEIVFRHDGTISAAYSYTNLGLRVGVLSFADAMTAGGLVLMGETGQEENICRCTNLYESLTTPVALVKYYNQNERMIHLYPYYTDTLVYSPNVTIFKDDGTYAELEEPRTVDIISCPSPNGGDTKELSKIIRNRIVGIVKAAIKNSVDILVLGAWGCGTFRQDPAIMGELFGEVIKEYERYFELVIFAIRTDFGRPNTLFEKFETNFWKGYNA